MPHSRVKTHTHTQEKWKEPQTMHTSLTLFAVFGYPSRVAKMVKNPPAHAGDAGNVGLIPRLGQSLGEGHGSPL